MAARFTRTALVLILVTLAGAGPVRAQGTADATLETGRRSIQLGNLAGDGASFGFWRMRSETTNLGIMIGASTGYSHMENAELDEEASSTGVSVSIGPELRRYTSTDGRVAPYGFVNGNVSAAYSRVSSGDDSSSGWAAGLGAGVGIGAEFFPVERLSLGGQMGVGAGFSYQPNSDDDPVSRWSVSLATFGARLTAAIYF